MKKHKQKYAVKKMEHNGTQVEHDGTCAGHCFVVKLYRGEICECL